MDFEVVLRSLVERLDEEQIRYAIIGGLAVHAWGRARPTQDADFAVDLGNRPQILRIMDAFGYRAAYVSDAFSNHEHDDPRWGRVDFMYVSGRTADSIFNAAVEKDLLPDHPVPVASPEHLAMMKAMAMKNFPHRALYEGEDVRVLLAVPGVDQNAIREFFTRHGLLELFDAIDQAR